MSISHVQNGCGYYPIQRREVVCCYLLFPPCKRNAAALCFLRIRGGKNALLEGMVVNILYLLRPMGSALHMSPYQASRINCRHAYLPLSCRRYGFSNDIVGVDIFL